MKINMFIDSKKEFEGFYYICDFVNYMYMYINNSVSASMY